MNHGCCVQMVQAYTGNDSVIEAATGERFVLMGGNIVGEFTQLVSQYFIHMAGNATGDLCNWNDDTQKLLPFLVHSSTEVSEYRRGDLVFSCLF